MNTTVVPMNTTVVPMNTTVVPMNTTVVPMNTTVVPSKEKIMLRSCKKALMMGFLSLSLIGVTSINTFAADVVTANYCTVKKVFGGQNGQQVVAVLVSYKVTLVTDTDPLLSTRNGHVFIAGGPSQIEIAPQGNWTGYLGPGSNFPVKQDDMYRPGSSTIYMVKGFIYLNNALRDKDHAAGVVLN
jgi:hypothetical protein